MNHQVKNIVISILLISLSLSIFLNIIQGKEEKAIKNDLGLLKTTYSCLFSDMELMSSALINNVEVDIFLKAIPECIVHLSENKQIILLKLNSLKMTVDSISQKVTNIEIEKIDSKHYYPCYRLMLPPTGMEPKILGIEIDEPNFFQRRFQWLFRN
jgi:hypothetical protein